MHPESNEKRFSIAYEMYADNLYRVAASMLRSDSDAEDAVQNAFCRYFSRAPEFSDAEHEKAWLLRVTINQCKDIMRRRKIRSWLPLDDLREVGVSRKETPVLDAIYTLPDKYRSVVILYHLEEMSIEETAAVLSLSASAVKMRLSRARDMLRAELMQNNK